MRTLLACLILAAAAVPAHAQRSPYAVNGVGLGNTEAEVKKRYPGAHCKPLEWKTDAAQRRCDDAKVAVGSINSRVTYYLKAGSVVGFDVRIDTKDLELFVRNLKAEFGPPTSEARDVIVRKGKDDLEVYKVLWEAGRDRALLSALKDKKRVQLEVSRGNFADEVYRVR